MHSILDSYGLTLVATILVRPRLSTFEHRHATAIALDAGVWISEGYLLRDYGIVSRDVSRGMSGGSPALRVGEVPTAIVGDSPTAPESA